MKKVFIKDYIDYGLKRVLFCDTKTLPNFYIEGYSTQNNDIRILCIFENGLLKSYKLDEEENLQRVASDLLNKKWEKSKC